MFDESTLWVHVTDLLPFFVRDYCLQATGVPAGISIVTSLGKNSVVRRYVSFGKCDDYYHLLTLANHTYNYYYHYYQTYITQRSIHYMLLYILNRISLSFKSCSMGSFISHEAVHQKEKG